MAFKKIQILAQNPNVLAFGFTENTCLWQKLIETPHFLSVTLIFWIGYT
jgi:hypothetical protein